MMEQRYTNKTKLYHRVLLSDEIEVTLANVSVGMKVRRGRHWNKNWRADIKKDDPCHISGTQIKKERLAGVVIGFSDSYGILHGQGGNQSHKHKSLRPRGETPACAIVEYKNGNRDVYPIGWEDVFALVVA